MNSQKAEMAYRRTAVEGASSMGLTIALYDTLAGDLRRASVAMRDGNIELRCRELNHALFVLGYLETWVDPSNREGLAQSLTGFYAHLRSKLMEGQLRQLPEIIEEQMRLVLQVRGAWQQMDEAASPAAEHHTPELDGPEYSFSAQEDRVAGSWSA